VNLILATKGRLLAWLAQNNRLLWGSAFCSAQFPERSFRKTRKERRGERFFNNAPGCDPIPVDGNRSGPSSQRRQFSGSE